MTKRYRSGWWLVIKYWEEGLTQAEIADECDVSPRTIRKYMERRGIPTREIKGENHPLHGKQRPEQVREKIAEKLSGREFDDESRAQMANAHSGVSLSEERRRKISEALTGLSRSTETRQRMSEATSGEDNPNWRGGYSRRYGSGWALAREKIRKRDEVCQHCGHDGSDRRLEVHHIEPVRRFREDPDRTIEEAHQLENLILLCKSCHVRADHGTISVDPPDREGPT